MTNVMRTLLVGNGVNLQFANNEYTVQKIVLRLLKNCDRDDFPKHIIIDEPYLLKTYMGYLYLTAREIINGDYDDFITCTAETRALLEFKKHYSEQIQSLHMVDISLEDYYLIHDLLCHKRRIVNPQQYVVRECLKTAYFFSIFNDGKINELYKQYPKKFIDYLNSFNRIYSTNYDENVDKVIDSEVYHIHGQFNKLADVYDENSLRNQLPDAPVKKHPIDTEYYYLYSNAISAHCGEYKEFQIKQNTLANQAIEKFAKAYMEDNAARENIATWLDESSLMVSNLGHAIVLKAAYPDLHFEENYHINDLEAITGTLEILGLSPWNDFHIFECINKANVENCIYYYHSEDQCEKIRELLPGLSAGGKIKFISSTEFWANYEEG